MLPILRRYRDFFVPFIGVLLVPFLTGATVFINPFMSFPAAGGSYLLEDNLEYADSTAAGVGGWTTVGAPTWAYATSPAPLQGSYSFYVSANGQYAYHSITSTGDVWAYCIVTPSTFTNYPYVIRFYVSGVTTILSAVRIDAGGGLRVDHGSANATSAGGTLTSGTTYHIWFHYVKGTGSDGVAEAYHSTTSTKPGSPTISLSNGTSTGDAGSFAMWPGVGSATCIYDRVIVSATSIGSAP